MFKRKKVGMVEKYLRIVVFINMASKRNFLLHIWVSA